jgi:hypothetical protein
MTFTNESLLPQTTYGIPSGNYDGSSTAFIGNAIPAANYYGGQGSAQTAILQLTNFIGKITLQGTLNSWTEQAAWFDIDSYGDPINPTTNTQAINMAGNFVWIRAAVTEFTGGVINSATVVF